MSGDIVNAPQPPSQRGWWGRNWKWVIPVGCILPLLVCCGGVTLSFYFVVSALKSSEVYRDAVAQAKANPQVKAALGEPISEGFMPNGSIETKGDTGSVNMVISLSGPKGSGKLNVIASMINNKWVYSKLEFVATDSESPINLLAKKADGQ